jgi:hypothetical protein
LPARRQQRTYGTRNKETLTLMIFDKRRTAAATAAVLGALAIAGPVAGAGAAATSPAPAPDVCAGVTSAGALAVLGPYGPLGAYGPLGDHAGQPNPATNCGGAASFALPGFTVGSFVNANLSIAHPVTG